MKSPFKTSTWLPLLVGLSLIACSKETIKEQKINDKSWGEIYKILYDLGVTIDDLKIAYSGSLFSAYDSNDEATSISAIGGFRGDDKFSTIIVATIDGKIVDIKDEFVCDLPDKTITIQEYGETKSYSLNYVSASRYLKNDSYSYLSVYNDYEGGVHGGRRDFRLLAKTPLGNKIITCINFNVDNDMLIPGANHCIIYGNQYFNQNLEMEYTINDNHSNLSNYNHRNGYRVGYSETRYSNSPYIGNYAFEYKKGKFLLSFFEVQETRNSNRLVFNAQTVDIINGNLLCEYSTSVTEGDNKYSRAIFNGIDSDGNYKFKVEYVTYEGKSIKYNCLFNPETQVFKEI